MAKNAYIGLMGSGKSFEVVSSVIIPALLKGRRVVTNIDGINQEKIYAYLCDVKGAKRDSIGEVISVTNEQVLEKWFFPDDNDAKLPSLVKGGDLVAIDECWKFWSTDNKILEEHMTFFRMHRHYTHTETGMSCDIALMIQDLGTLHRKVKATVEMTCRTVKLKSLGVPKAYRCELYEGNKTTRGTKIDTHVKMYDKAIFPLYKSYASGDGKETSIDKRQNIFTNPRLWFMVIFVSLMFGIGGYLTYRFFNPKQIAVKPSGSTSSSGAPGTPGTNAQLPRISEFSKDWRYAGSFTAKGESWVILVDSQGHLRVESPSVFTGKGITAVGSIDSQKVTFFSGQAQSSLLPSTQPSPEQIK